jgi:hypothetical protein
MSGEEMMISIKPKTHFDTLGRFTLLDYQRARPFSSFLPGIAGVRGIPLWVFYTNRGQGITCFGVESKDRPVMEFQPANKAYQLTSKLGFRTFLKLRRSTSGGTESFFYEPFGGSPSKEVQRVMFTGMNEVEICETHPALELETSVLYFVLPGQPFAALVRRVTFRNLGSTPLSLETLDGLPAVIPFGTSNGALKDIGRTIEAWMEVLHTERRIPFFKLRASAGDTAEVKAIGAGNFALAFSSGDLLPALVDPQVIFGSDTAFCAPEHFAADGLETVLGQPQICEGRTPCSFFGAALNLEPLQSQSITSLYGSASSFQVIENLVPQVASPEFIDARLEEARNLANELTSPIATQTALPVFDAYCRQTFLDNLLRGGWPLILGGKHVYHVYSRKHGDMERDYNYFILAAEHYSQGNGNYRDVNQNRRCDVYFEPRIEDFNIRLFASLLQADGYNPLVVKGTDFFIPESSRDALLAQVGFCAPIAELLSAPFTPGQLLAAAQLCELVLPPTELLDLVLRHAEQHIHADYGEGYWIDHWTYILDQIDAYLNIYPDKKTSLLFDSRPIPFFDSAMMVRPRSQRYVLSGGNPRQLNALQKDPEKASMIAARSIQPQWARSDHGNGEIFTLPLFAKLILLAALKFASRDPFGIGIEMEAGRPGWYDALNGLPGLFGSSMPEIFELLRLVDFLIDALSENRRETALPVEAYRMLQDIFVQLSAPASELLLWQVLSESRENYRDSVRLGFSGETAALPPDSLIEILQRMKTSLQSGIERALVLGNGLTPTYFTCQPSEYDILNETDAEDRPFIRVKAFQAAPLPLFLEGPVRHMKVLSRSEALHLHEKVRGSALYDLRLKMFKVNASLNEQPHDIGRARAFSPGWLENESIWLHMSYKYLLELLRSGLYEQFFDELKTNLVPFMDPAVYGRSPLENSSFIVSSAHPDQSLHGAGFVARLSGSTAEFLSMWNLMMTGAQPFTYTGGSLHLSLAPTLPGWLFSADGLLSFRFLGHTTVTYNNPSRRDTFSGLSCQKSILQLHDGEIVVLPGGPIPAPYAEMVRAGSVRTLEIHLH